MACGKAPNWCMNLSGEARAPPALKTVFQMEVWRGSGDQTRKCWIQLNEILKDYGGGSLFGFSGLDVSSWLSKVEISNCCLRWSILLVKFTWFLKWYGQSKATQDRESNKTIQYKIFTLLVFSFQIDTVTDNVVSRTDTHTFWVRNSGRFLKRHRWSCDTLEPHQAHG